MVAALTVGGGIAGAVGTGSAAVDAPSAGAPHYNQNPASEIIRGSGSDTTFFVMQKISDIYNAAGLYGCTLTAGGTGQTLFDGSATLAAEPANHDCQAGGYPQSINPGSADVQTTDQADNWNRTEVLQGVNDVGSGYGQKQLCSTLASPDAVDFARSSKPAGTYCTLQELGYAKDGVEPVDFPGINPSTYGTSHFTSGQVASGAYPNVPYASINGGVVGPVAAGWLPGDNPAGTANRGTKLAQLTNTGAIDSSVAFRMYCTSATSSNAITDWGQLENLGPNLEVNVDTTSGSPTVNIDASSGTSFPTSITSGKVVTSPYSDSTLFASGTTVSTNGGSTLTLNNNASATGEYTLIFAVGGAKLALGSGVPIGIPIRIVGVNPGSGTTYTFAQFAQGQTADTNGCPDSTPTSTDTNLNAANDPLGSSAAAGNPQHIALENNAHQLEAYSTTDFPSDTVDQAIEEATSLYFMSFGVQSTNTYVSETTIGGTNYGVNALALNGIFASAGTEIDNAFPTARTLSNVIRPDLVRESTAGFANWLCDPNANFQKGTDLTNGTNYDTELGNLISTQYGFPRVTDLSAAVSPANPADNTAAPNDDCVAQIPVTTQSGSSTVTFAGPNYDGTTFPASIIPASDYGPVGAGVPTPGTVVEIAGASGAVPANTAVTSNGGSTTLTLSNPISTTGTITLEFYGVPSVISATTTP